MKVIDIIKTAKDALVSYEIVPPPRGSSAKDVLDVVEALQPYNPAWVDVTSHSPVASYHERRDGTIHKRIQKKRPGTLALCGIIQNRFKVDTVAHVLSLGFTPEETEDALIELNYLGVENILALRGDGHDLIASKGGQHRYAKDLVLQIQKLKNGHYLSSLDEAEPLDFCVGVAGYPEKHFEAANLKTDVQFLKQKVDAGADYIVTQMFFDNQKYFEFVDLCRSTGIQVPIIPGLKVIKTHTQLKSLPRAFHINMPEELVERVTAAAPEKVFEVGIDWAQKQSKELLDRGAPGVHFYVMNDASHVSDVFKYVRKL